MTTVSRPAPRPGLLDIAPYVAGASRIPGRDRVFKLASNEAALGPSPAAVAAWQAAAEQIHLYPDARVETLRTAVAEHHGLAPDQLVFGTGSESLLDLLIRCYAGPGDEVLAPSLSFPLYRILAAAVGAHYVEAPAPDYRADVDALLARVTPATKVALLANPNNPTGTWIPRSEIIRLREGLPGHVLLVVDSAYGEYPDDPDYSDGIDIVAAYPDNTIMTRTFSKMYALASARVGWAYAGVSIISVLERIRLVFSVSAGAEQAACAALADEAHMMRERAHCREWRARLSARLRDIGLFPVEGEGNFVFLPVPDHVGGWQALDAHLKGDGLLVRPIPPARALRISIGGPQAMDALTASITAFHQAVRSSAPGFAVSG